MSNIDIAPDLMQGKMLEQNFFFLIYDNMLPEI